MKTLGFLAVGNNGELLTLASSKHPRKQLLEKLGRKGAEPIYAGLKDGGTERVGWIVGGVWWSIYRVCPL